MSAVVESIIEDTREPEKPIDRKEVCPLLLRVFINNGRHNVINEYNRGNTPVNELQIYTWLDASLKELTGLVKEVNTDARRKGTFFDFAVVYPDQRLPIYRMRDIGTTCTGRKGADDAVTLLSKRFQIGDFLDVAITPPRGDSRGPPNMMRRRPMPY